MNAVSQSFFDFFSRNENRKLRCQTANGLGYSSVKHKEGVKLLTTQDGRVQSTYHLPKNTDAAVRHISQSISHATSQLQQIIAQLMGVNLKQSKHVQISDLAMLDIVHYFNTNTGPQTTPQVGYDTSDVNCVPHFDPGLFSLSIISTSDGLQLKDQLKNQWIDGPITTQADQSNIGVIWLGEAASILTNNRFKAGIHRVIYPRTPHQARLTIWQEVCTQSQIDQLFEQNTDAHLLPHGASVKLANQPDSKPMAVLPGGETRSHFLKRIEADRGLSESKSGMSHMRLHTNASSNQNEQFVSSNQTSNIPNRSSAFPSPTNNYQSNRIPSNTNSNRNPSPSHRIANYQSNSILNNIYESNRSNVKK